MRPAVSLLLTTIGGSGMYSVAVVGWRQTYVGIGIFCLATILPLRAKIGQPA